MSDDKPRRADDIDIIDVEGPASGKDAQDQNEDPSSKEDDEEEETAKITVEIDPAVAQRIRSAVYHTPGLTMWQVVQRGIEVVVDHLEEKRGEEFPRFDGSLEGGRPPKGMGRPKL